MNALILEKQTFKIKTLVTVIGIIACIALPQAFHAIGAVSGLGTAFGAAFLPMHLPVLTVGLVSGSWAGLICGALSPVISFALSGMPVAAKVPFMAVELAFYGLVAGLLCGRTMPVIAKVLIAQISGRVMRFAASAAAIYIIGFNGVGIADVWNAVPEGLPGIILQLCLIPLMMFRINARHE